MKLYKDDSIEKIKKIEKEARIYFNKKKDISKDLSYGVAGSTFRSFSNYNKPSYTYKQWVERIINSRSILWDIQTIKTKDNFYEIHASLSKDLDRFWNKNQNTKLELCKRNKLLDLFLRYLSLTNEAESNNIANVIISYGNIPLDKFSLLAVKDLFYGIVISQKPSMGDIVEIDTYLFLQNQIYQLMKDSEMPNLYFDYYWNISHPGK